MLDTVAAFEGWSRPNADLYRASSTLTRAAAFWVHRNDFFSLSEQILRPRLQPSDIRGTASNRPLHGDPGVDAEYSRMVRSMIGSLDYPDLISGAPVALDDDSQVSPGSQRLGEAARKHLVIHPNSKPPARDARLGNLEHRAADPPALSDERIVHLDPFGREVFAELADAQALGRSPAPTTARLRRRRRRPPCRARRALFDPPGVSVKVYASRAIRPATGDFQIALFAGRPLYSNSRAAPTLTERTLPSYSP